MASRVVMPKLSDTMEEGRILRWLKQEGDPVETGQALAEVETDKATVEMEAYTNGVLRKLFVPQGETVKVGRLIAVVGAADEDISAIVAEAEKGGEEKTDSGAAAHAAVAAPTPETAPPTSTTARAGSVRQPSVPPARREAEAAPPAQAGETRRAYRASPLAARMAAEAGLDLNAIEGSGPQGRIVKRDIEAAIEGGAQPARAAAAERPAAARPRVAAVEGPEYEDVELSQMRRTIARRLVQAKAPVPHFYLTVDLPMDRTWESYRALRESKSPITINDIVIKAVAAALRRHPDLNASFAGDHVRRYNRVHIGMAVSLDEGLITPVIRDADMKTLEELSAESKELVERARSRRLQPHEYTGSTFSISNLGMMDIDEFSAVINPPEAAILAVGAVRQVPVVEDGQVKVGYRMKATLSIDHRVADGAMGARFLQTLRRLLEHPLLMA